MAQNPKVDYAAATISSATNPTLPSLLPRVRCVAITSAGGVPAGMPIIGSRIVAGMPTGPVGNPIVRPE